MGLKFNGTGGGDFVFRWYDTANGNVIETLYDKPYTTEVEFSRNVLKTKPRRLTIHPDHIPDESGFWFNGYQADKDQRITFATGIKDRLVISKNVVDFMFCTTDQSFTSCYKLQNGAESDLKRMHKCPGIYIVYTTQENSDYEWRGEVYTHPKMSGRAFLYESEDRRHYTCGRPYGKTGFEIRDVLRRWLPNGLEIGWQLSDEQKDLAPFEKDNFSQHEWCAIHDRWDKVFDTNELYYQDGLNIKIGDKEMFGEERKTMATAMARLKHKAEKYAKEGHDDD